MTHQMSKTITCGDHRCLAHNFAKYTQDNTYQPQVIEIFKIWQKIYFQNKFQPTGSGR